VPETATATEALQAQRAGERQPAHALDLEQRMAGPTRTPAATATPAAPEAPAVPGEAPGEPKQVLQWYLDRLGKQNEFSQRMVAELLPAWKRHLDAYLDAVQQASAHRVPKETFDRIKQAAQDYLTVLTEAKPWLVTQPIPEPPSRRPRPFLDPEGGSALQRVVQTLGLMATMAAGLAGGAPVAALQALTGAMQGWQEGDRERAEARWREYLAKVDQIKANNELVWKTYSAALEQSRGRVQAAQALLAADLAEQGQDQRLVDLAGRNLDGFSKMMQMLQHMTRQVGGDTHQLASMMLRFLNADQMRQVHAQMEKYRAQQLATIRALAGLHPNLQKIEGQFFTATQNVQLFPRVLAAVDRLAALGILPKGPGLLPQTFAEVRKQIAGLDPARRARALADLNTLEAQLIPLVVASDVLRGEPAGVMRLKSVTEPQIRNKAWSRDFYWELLTGRGAPRELITSEATVQALLEDPRRLTGPRIDPSTLSRTFGGPATPEDWASLTQSGGLWGLTRGRLQIAAEMLQQVKRHAPDLITPTIGAMLSSTLMPRDLDPGLMSLIESAGRGVIE
jgi:hypothetical protein